MPSCCVAWVSKALSRPSDFTSQFQTQRHGRARVELAESSPLSQDPAQLSDRLLFGLAASLRRHSRPFHADSKVESFAIALAVERHVEGDEMDAGFGIGYRLHGRRGLVQMSVMGRLFHSQPVQAYFVSTNTTLELPAGSSTGWTFPFVPASAFAAMVV